MRQNYIVPVPDQRNFPTFCVVESRRWAGEEHSQSDKADWNFQSHRSRRLSAIVR